MAPAADLRRMRRVAPIRFRRRVRLIDAARRSQAGSLYTVTTSACWLDEATYRGACARGNRIPGDCIRTAIGTRYRRLVHCSTEALFVKIQRLNFDADRREHQRRQALLSTEDSVRESTQSWPEALPGMKCATARSSSRRVSPGTPRRARAIPSLGCWPRLAAYTIRHVPPRRYGCCGGKLKNPGGVPMYARPSRDDDEPSTWRRLRNRLPRGRRRHRRKRR